MLGPILGPRLGPLTRSLTAPRPRPSRTVESFGAIGVGNDREVWNAALDWAMRRGGVIECDPAATYRVDEMTFALPGGEASYVLTGCDATSELNLIVSVRDAPIEEGRMTAQGGFVQRPGIDFTYDPQTQTLTPTTPWADVPSIADPEVSDNPVFVRYVLAIQASNVRVNGNGAAFCGDDCRFWAVGAPTTDGQTPPLSNIVLRDFRPTGNGEDAGKAPKAPFMSWVRDCLVEEVHTDALSGTDFNLHFAWDTVYRNCSSTGSNAGFAGLMMHCRRCRFEDFEATDKAGETNLWGLGYQIKGGEDCQLLRCNTTDVTGAGSTDYLIYIRGDDPFDAAGTYFFGVYPYANGKGWWEADDDRATRNATVQDCTLTYSPGFAGTKLVNGITAQEQFATLIDGCTLTRCGPITASKSAGSTETGPTVSNCSINSSTGRGVWLLGVSALDPMVGAVVEGTTVAGSTGEGIFFNFCADPEIDGNTVSGSTSTPLRTLNTQIASIGTNTCIVATTDATVTNAMTTTLADGSYTLHVDITATGGFSCVGDVPITVSGGTVTVVSTAGLVVSNPDSLGGVTVDSSTVTLRVRLTGKAATNVTWTCVLSLEAA